MPWLSVERNVSFGLRGDDASALAAEALHRVGLADFARALPKELSGGMAQRTAIARALVTKPPVLLLDEPFSALDAFTRIDLQEHLLEVWRWYRPTTLLVTHDIDEALMLADRIVVLGGQPGRIQAEIDVDLPRPRDRTQATFHAYQDRAMTEFGCNQREARRPGSGPRIPVACPELVIEDEERPRLAGRQGETVDDGAHHRLLFCLLGDEVEQEGDAGQVPQFGASR